MAELKPIPVSAAANIADSFGYDQVVIIARRVGDDPDPHGEHVTTYGRDPQHCAIAAATGGFLKHMVMGWPRDRAWTQEENSLHSGAEALARLFYASSPVDLYQGGNERELSFEEAAADDTTGHIAQLRMFARIALGIGEGGRG